jgi:Putative phage metallopeptidase
MVHIHDTTKEHSKENDAVRGKKEKVIPIPLLISSSEAVNEIVKKLVPKHYPELIDAHILCLCRNRASKAAGIPIPGAIRKANPTERYLTSAEGDEGANFILTVALDVWNDLQPNQRLALVDHLLARCVATEDETTGEHKYGLRPPQVQEFPEVAERNGKWNEGLVALGDSLRGK